LPLEKLNGGLDVDAPPLIKGYLKLGAKICSAPAWDPDFNTADLLTMLRLLRHQSALCKALPGNISLSVIQLKMPLIEAHF
jgi:putative hemolysin